MAAKLHNHINDYSVLAREIIEYLNFDDQIERMDAPKITAVGLLMGT